MGESSGTYTGPAPRSIKDGFKLMAQSQEDEDAFDWIRFRGLKKPSGSVASVAHIVKGALGGGILGSHVAFMKAGVVPGIILTIFFGVYIAYNLILLVIVARIMYKRTRIPIMSYADLGEAIFTLSSIKACNKSAKLFRYLIDFTIVVDLYGSCACYQIIIAKSVKQLIEDKQRGAVEPLVAGYPGLRVYLACFIIPVICICLIRHLDWLAPFSLVANFFIVIAIGLTIYYAMQNNPKFENLKAFTTPYQTVEFLGMIVFSMSCAGVVIPITNNMKNPLKYIRVVSTGMFFVVSFVLLTSFFGYVGYLEKCDSPITINFPMTFMPKLLKGLIAVMIYVTHALNFWVPFNHFYHYIEPRLRGKLPPTALELVTRAVHVFCISLLAICFPNINSLMGFLGAFCLSNMAFIWPNFFEILLFRERPGFGRFNWRFWKAILSLILGFFLCVAGSIVNLMELFTTM